MHTAAFGVAVVALAWIHGRGSRAAKGSKLAMIRKVSAKPTVEHAVGGCGYDFDPGWGVSKKPTVERDVGECVGVVEITFTVHTQAATFVSSTAAKREASSEWIAEYSNLSSQLQAYESLREEVARRYVASRQTPPSTDIAEVVWERNGEAEIQPKVRFHGSGERPTPAGWKDANLAYINDRLEELDHYRLNAGVTPTPVNFHQQLRQDIDKRFMPLLGCIRQLNHQLEETCEHLFRELANDDVIAQIKSQPIGLTRRDRSSDREYALYRGMVWECERSLLPEQWRILADAYLAREEAEFSRALGLQHQPQQENREAIPTTIRRAVWSRDGGRCAQCGSRDRLEYDHIIPISKGGGNTERNIELLCEACNRSKSDSII